MTDEVSSKRLNFKNIFFMTSSVIQGCTLNHIQKKNARQSTGFFSNKIGLTFIRLLYITLRKLTQFNQLNGRMLSKRGQVYTSHGSTFSRLKNFTSQKPRIFCDRFSEKPFSKAANSIRQKYRVSTQAASGFG
jgi:hypothetical protein